MGKPTTSISAPQVHSILKQFNYEMVQADPERQVKKIAKGAARDFPGVKISAGGDSVYFRYNGNDGQGPSGEFFVQAKGMMLENSIKKLEQLTGIKFAQHIKNQQGHPF
ncbi:MAG TPA: hypothetical protein VGD95_00530 [Micavibrio sp.]